jgi:hypothetical protein
MAYIPKSKVNILNTPGNEFIKKFGGEGYVGKYMELSNGKYYAGSDPSNLGEELIIPLAPNQLNNTIDSVLYSNLKPKKAKFLTQIQSVYPSKSIPTEEDYKRGYYSRYFAKKVNDPKNYMEIDAGVFNSINQQKNQYDFRLYEVGSVTWNLKNGIRRPNFINLQLLERSFPFVSLLFPKLDEFERIDGVLTTQGGELYYENGKEYIGPYHLHEGMPMVGPTHTEESHANLFYSKDLQDPNQELKDKYTPDFSDQPTEPPTPTPATVTYKGDSNFSENTAASMKIDLDLLKKLGY